MSDQTPDNSPTPPAADPTPGGTADEQSPEATPLVVAVNVVGDNVGGGLGRAHTMAVATVANGRIVDWDVEEVGWDVLHDEGPEGTHHARIVRFMRDHQVGAVVSGHMGPPMANTLAKLGVLPLVDATGDARQAALAGAAMLVERRAEE